MRNLLRDETGSLTLEWIFLLTLLVLGIVGGMAVVRDAVILEAGESAEATVKLNDGFSVSAPPNLSVNSKQSAEINGFGYDAPELDVMRESEGL